MVNFLSVFSYSKNAYAVPSKKTVMEQNILLKFKT